MRGMKTLCACCYRAIKIGDRIRHRDQGWTLVDH